MLTVTELGVFDSSLKFPGGGLTPERVTKRLELEFYLSGTGFSVLDGVTYPHREHMIVCAPPGTRRFSQGRFTCFYFHLSEDPALADALKDVPRCFACPDPEVFRRRFTGLIEAYHTPGPAARLKLESEIFALFALLTSPHALRSSPVAAAVDFMQAHYRENLSLGRIAAHAALSPAHFHRRFREETGLTPREQLLSIRLSAAQRMLLTESTPLSEIAEACGFSSQPYFQACFKKETGMTPGRFRATRFAMPEK